MNAMASRGWTVPDWPEAYGGGGLSPAESKILREEMAAMKCRNPLNSFGISMLGPALLKYGTEEQKLDYLPKIARGEIRWCQGYSEPNAGSDLASLAKLLRIQNVAAAVKERRRHRVHDAFRVGARKRQDELTGAGHKGSVEASPKAGGAQVLDRLHCMKPTPCSP